MNEHLEALLQHWTEEIAAWEHCALLSASDEAVRSRCMVRVWTIKDCLDDLKLALRK